MTPKVDRRDTARQVPSPPTERVISVMHLLAADMDRTFSLAEISRRLGISRATGHAILATLATHQWVMRDEQTGSYSRGPAVAALARAGNNRAFRPVLQHLSELVGAQAFLARRDGASLLVVDAVGDTLTGPRIGAGFRVPLVAPFGRDYVAWAAEKGQQAWLDGIGESSPKLRKRLLAVLEEVRRRGYVIERLSQEYVRVYAALRALAVDGEPDVITRQLARAFADLALVDYLADELGDSGSHRIATVSAPIRDSEQRVTMSITAAPFAALTSAAVYDLGSQVRDAAHRIEDSLRGVA